MSLLFEIVVAIISAFYAGDDVSQYAFGDFARYTDTRHQRLGGTSQVVETPGFQCGLSLPQ